MRWERSGTPKSKSHLNISVYHVNTLQSLYNFIWFCEDCFAPFILEFSRNTQSWQYWHFCTISNGISWKDLPVNKFKCRFTFVMVHWINSSGSRIFLRERALWKLHENERNLDLRGVRVPGAPLHPPMLKVYKFDQHLCLAYFDIYAIQKCQHCQLCILRKNSIALAMCGGLQLLSLFALSVL